MTLPILEGQDEHEHVGVIEHIVTRGEYPVIGPDTPTHAYQPPLYYVIGALVAARAPRVEALPRNPYFGYDLRLAAGRSALLAGMALTIAGPWFARNYRLYGDVTGVAALDARLGMVGWWWQGWGWLVGVAEGANRDFWIRFGWGNVSAPAPVYWGLASAAALSVIGLTRWVAARGWRRDGLPAHVALVIASAALLAVAATLAYPFVNRHGVQGRLFLYPALPAIAILAVVGWRQWLPTHWSRPRLFALYLTGLFGLALYAWLAVLRPAYAPPPLLRDDA